MNEVEVKMVRNAQREEIAALYRDAGWWKKEYDADNSFIDGMVKCSLCFVGAFHRGRMIGMGRCLSDGVSDAYIQDVTVLQEFRGRGIGKRIIRELLRHIGSHGIDWIGLIAEPGTVAFYRGIGFREMEGSVPMRFHAI